MNSTPPARRRVLLVDDHALMRQSIAETVNRAPDLQVCGEVDSVTAALQIFDQAQPHLVVTDLSLPERNGFNLIEKFCERAPTIPVLVLSMHSSAFHAPKAFRAGAAGYVMKGDGAQLLAAIRGVAAGEIHLDDQVRREIIHQLQVEKGGGSQPPWRRLTDEERAVFGLRGRRMGIEAIAETLRAEPARIVSLVEGIRQKLRLGNDVAVLHHAILWRNAGEPGSL